MDKILDILKYINSFGFEAYVVGGFVRDKLLNIESFDVDICTSATNEELKIIMPQAKQKALFCTSFVLDEFNIEITSFRKEENYNGRRPLTVTYTNKLIDDLQRRDFTINTICMDKNGKIIDLLNGLDDLNNKIIRCVGDSDLKIKEDTLRILRAIRLACYLDFKLDDNLVLAFQKYQDNLSFLSSFRKRQELDKIIKYKGLSLIKELDIEDSLGIIIPNNIKYVSDTIGIYAQCDINLDNFFNKQELKKYNLLKKYLHKKIDKYDLFILGIDNSKILGEIMDTDLVKKYEELKIHDERELDINLNKLNSEIKEKIIRAILDKKVENNSFSIANFITNLS